MHVTAKTEMMYFIHDYLSREKQLKILDVGSLDINGSFRELFDTPNWEYIGCDIEPGKNVDIVLKDPYKWDFRYFSFDVVISGSTFEHIECPWLTIKQMARVLKPEGLCCIIVPSHGWGIHRHPIDCWRILPDGMRALAKYANLEVIESRQVDVKKYPDDAEGFKDCFFIGKK